jgi:tetratricopeptide (TPR) repeat protein
MEQKLAVALRRNLGEALSRGDLDDARAVLRRLEAEDPLSAETRGLRLEYLVRTGALDDARRLAEQLVVAFPTSPGVLYWAGRAAFLGKDYEEAARLLREAHAARPHPLAEQWLAKAATNLGRFEEAEPILVRLAERSPRARLDLAWLYERKGEDERALRSVELYLAAYPDHDLAKEQRQRLRARLADPDELLGEVAMLADLGEDVPAEILPEAVERLFAAGRAAEARALVQGWAPRLEPRLALRTAWAAHRLAAYDLSYDLFVRALPSRPRDFKLLGALEKAARTIGRTPDLAAVYESLLAAAPALHGRLARLRRALEEEQGGGEIK